MTDKSITDTVQLIKQVAHTVQTISGQVADALEKLTNLTRWHPAHITAQIYRTMWIVFVLSLFLPNGYVLSIIGVFIGVKVFIIDTVYRKYPKVKERYDSMTKMYRLLLTNEQLEAQCIAGDNISTDTAISRQCSLDSKGNECSSVAAEDYTDFCGKFAIKRGEQPVDGWQVGRKCTLIDREKPLAGSKGGTLYLTQSYLCFEFKTSEQIIIQLTDIVSVKKSKAFAFLPGSGMAIEIVLKSSDKSLLFGALLNRDQVLNAILEQGFLLGLAWGLDMNHTPQHDPSAAATGPTEIEETGC